jgi:hypothetical protein
MTYAIDGLFAGGAAALSSRFIAIATFFRHCQQEATPVDDSLEQTRSRDRGFFGNSQQSISINNNDDGVVDDSVVIIHQRERHLRILYGRTLTLSKREAISRPSLFLSDCTTSDRDFASLGCHNYIIGRYR